MLPPGSARSGASGTHSRFSPSACPILLFQQFLPERVQQGAETAVAALIVFLALRLLVRWRHGYFDLHAHPHEHASHRHPVRSPLGAFGIGLVHGTGGSAGVGDPDPRRDPVVAGRVRRARELALFTAVSMTIVTTGLGRRSGRRPLRTAFAGVAPVLGLASLAFGSGTRRCLERRRLPAVGSRGGGAADPHRRGGARRSRASTPTGGEYFAGGAGDERTLRRNVDAFAYWRLRQRVLCGIDRGLDRNDRARPRARRAGRGRPDRLPADGAPRRRGGAWRGRPQAAGSALLPLDVRDGEPHEVAAAAPEGSALPPGVRLSRPRR